MKIIFLIPIAAFLVLLPWIQGLSTGINNEVMVDGITISATVVMTITLAFSLISWALFSWASRAISLAGALLAIISGASLVIPFLQVLGPMAGILVGVVAGFGAVMLQKKMDTARNRPVVIAGATLGSAYIVLIVIVLITQTSHVWDTGDGAGSWSGTIKGTQETGYHDVFNKDISFAFFFAIIPSLILTERIIGMKNKH